MGWPLSQDYNEAVQNPRTVFADPDLKAGQAVPGPLGLPMIDVTVDLGDKIHKKVEILVDAEHKHDFVAHGAGTDRGGRSRRRATPVARTGSAGD